MPNRRPTRSSDAPSTRTRTVWLSLGASMMLVTTLLFVLGPRTGGQGRFGFSLTPLTRMTGQGGTVDPIFQTKAPLEDGRWTAIVIHHSGSPVGSPASISAQHRSIGLDGTSYHFIVGNGLGMEDGSIHVGYRWLEQRAGVQATGDGADALNEASIGICLVGDGNRRPFTPGQIEQLAAITATLADRCGIDPDRILLHSEVAQSDSPGRFFPDSGFRRQVAAMRTHAADDAPAFAAAP